MIKRAIALLLGLVVLSTSCPEVVKAAEIVTVETQEGTENIQEEAASTELAEEENEEDAVLEEVAGEEAATVETVTEEIASEEMTANVEDTEQESVSGESVSSEEITSEEETVSIEEITSEETVTEEELTTEEETTTQEELTTEEETTTEEFITDLQAGKETYSSLTVTKDYILDSDMIITGDVAVDAGKLDLNGYTMTVQGDVKIKTATLSLNGGRLNVKGDFQLGDYDSYSHLIMNQDDDTLNVDGDIIVCSRYGTELTAGTIYLKGDFAQQGQFSSSSEMSFKASGSHTTVFCGKNQQSISFEASGSTFNIVKFENKNIQIKSRLNGFMLGSDADLNLQLPEDGLYISNILDLNGYDLTIRNNLNVMRGGIILNGATLEITGDFSLGTKEQLDAGNPSAAYIQMKQEADTLIVGGDFITCSSREADSGSSGKTILTNGTMRLKGSLYQYGDSKEGAFPDKACEENFVSQDNHKIVFCGTDWQNIYFQSSSSEFYLVKFENSKIELLSSINAFKLYDDSSLILKTSDTNRVERYVDLNGKKLTVHNDLRLDKGWIEFNGGTLHVKGDFSMGTQEKVDAGKTLSGYLLMENEADLLVVDGDVAIYGGRQGKYTAGTMQLSGDFKIYNDMTESYYSIFNSCKEHKVVFCGKGEQEIYFDSVKSGFNIVEFENSNIEIQSPIRGFKLGKDAVLNLTIPKEGLSTVINDSSIDLNGYDLTITKDLLLSEGSIDLNEGTLTVKGNLSIGSKGLMESGKTAKSWIRMDNDTDVLNVDGDLEVCSRYQTYFIAGTINLKGDLSQYGTEKRGDDYHGRRDALKQYGTNVLKFCGNGLQSVYFDSTESSVLNVEFVNKNVELKSAIGGSLDRDNMKWYWKVPDTGLEIDSQLTLDGKTLTICGDLNLASGKIYFKGGTLNVQGSLKLGTKEGKTSSAELWMISDTDVLNIDGDFVNRCDYSAHQIGAGTINLKGNFAQYETIHPETGEKSGRFYATGSNRLVLCGNKKQSITFESESSFFNIVELKQSNANYIFKPHNCYKKIIYNTGGEKNIIRDVGEYVYTGNEIIPDVKVYENDILLVKDIDYTMSVTNNIAVGDVYSQEAPMALIKCKGDFSGEYVAYFSITPCDLTKVKDVSLTVNDAVYTGKAIKPTITLMNGKMKLQENKDYTVSCTNNIEAGTAQVVITGIGNYVGVITREFRIIEKVSSDFTIKGEGNKALTSQTYTGYQLKPVIEVYNGKVLLVEEKDYTVSYGENVNVGKGQITIKGIGIYDGEKTVSFNITALDVNDTKVKVVALSDCIYDAAMHKPSVTVKYGNRVLVENTDYKITYANNKNAALSTVKNAPTVIVTGKGNFKGTRKVTFNIKPYDFSNDTEMTVTAKDMMYTGKPVKAAVTVKKGKLTLKQNTDYTVTYKNNVEAGMGTVVITGKGNYTGTIEKEFRIILKNASALTIKGEGNKPLATQTYNGTQLKPTIEVYNGKTLLTEDADYIVTYGENIKAGKGQITIEGIGIYAGKKTVTFQITALNLSSDVIEVDALEDCTYNGTSQKPVVTVRYGSEVLIEKKDYVLTYTNNKNAACSDAKKAPTITITGKGNYKGTRKVNFDILCASLVEEKNDDIVITVADMIYNKGKECKPAVTVKDGKIILKNKTDYVLSYENNRELGEKNGANPPTVIITGKGNYAGSELRIPFRIYESAISKIKVAAIPTQTYTGEQLTPNVNVTMGSGKNLITLKQGTDYYVSYGENIKYGTGTVTIHGMGIYGGTKKVSFKIAKKAMNSDDIVIHNIYAKSYTSKPIVQNNIKVYDGERKLEENKDYTVSYANNVKAAERSGAKPPTVIITGKGNYSGSKKETFKIWQQDVDSIMLDIEVADALYAKGKKATPAVKLKHGNYTLQKNKDYRIEYFNNTAIAEKNSPNAPYVKITGIGNYTGTKEVTFRIYEKAISSAKIAKIPNQKFTGSQLTPQVIVTMGSGKTAITLEKGKDYTLTYGENVKTGTGYVYINGIGTYGGVKKVSFKIVK